MGVPLRVPFRDTIRVILEGFRVLSMTVWFLVGNGGMDYGDHYWGLCRDYYRDPFPHSLLSTRQWLHQGIEGLEFGVEGTRRLGVS